MRDLHLDSALFRCGNLILYNTELPKIIIEQCHQTNNEKKAEQNAAFVPPLESRRKLCQMPHYCKFTNKLRSYVTEFDCPRIITSTIARLRTEHFKGMKIHQTRQDHMFNAKHCPDLQLTPNHILNAQPSQQSWLKMGMVPLRDSLWELLYSPDAPRIAEAVIKTFDGI
ncbi:hypothetical protein TNCV_3951691 [Trichonephila clavipes]|nr:hypothetical protein TNCV_3951691 [Trichonephila clavipes]